MRSQPSVYGARILLGGEAAVYSLDAKTGCMHWAVETPSPVRSGIAVGWPGNTPFAFYGDGAGNVIVNAPNYVCCTFRGSVLALDAQTGELLWQTYTIDEAPQAGVSRRGTKTKGPSGAGVWSAPTIDVEKGILYATTGDNYSDPPSSKSDSVLALSMDTGKLLWSKRLRAGDAWNVGCMDPGKKICPDAEGLDYDLGSPSILVKLPDGRRILVLSKKSGAVYGVDPDQQGRLLCQSQVGKGACWGDSNGVPLPTVSDYTSPFRTRPFSSPLRRATQSWWIPSEEVDCLLFDWTMASGFG